MDLFLWELCLALVLLCLHKIESIRYLTSSFFRMTNNIPIGILPLNHMMERT